MEGKSSLFGILEPKYLSYPEEWWKENLSDVPLKSLKELIDTNLHLSAANDTKIPFDAGFPLT